MQMTESTCPLDRKPTRKINVVIPMAGEGSRFANAGFVKPKPLIPVGGRPMIKWVVDSLTAPSYDLCFIFIVRSAHDRKYGIRQKLLQLARDVTVVLVDDLTDGPVSTCLLASGLVGSDRPLLLANSDQFVEWDASAFFDRVLLSSPPLDGGMVTFRVPFERRDTRWSFARTDMFGYVTECREKEVISEEATAGLYFFARGSDFVKYAQQMVSKNLRVNNEFYVCPVYNQGIADGQKYVCHRCSRMWGLGVPDDVKTFLRGFLGWADEDVAAWEAAETSAQPGG